MDKFAPLISVQEFWSSVGFWILVVGLIGDIITLVIPAHRGRLEKALAAIFTIVVIVGCTLEHIADGKIDALVSREESAAALEIAQDKTTAQMAAKQAANLGVTVKSLPNFVTQKEGEINGQISRFQKFAEAQQTKNNATIDLLTRAEDEVTKARIEAIGAANVALAASAPRTLKPDQQNEFVMQTKLFSGLAANIFVPPSTTSDSGPLANLLGSLLRKANWKIGDGTIMGGWAKSVLVGTGAKAKPTVTAAAVAIVQALRRAGIQASIAPGLGPSTPMFVTGSPLPHSDMIIIVGAKQ